MRFPIWVKIIAAITSVLFIGGVIAAIGLIQTKSEALNTIENEPNGPCRLAIDLNSNAFLAAKSLRSDITHNCGPTLMLIKSYEELLEANALSVQDRENAIRENAVLRAKAIECEALIAKSEEAFWHLPTSVICPNHDPEVIMRSGYLGTDIQDTMVAFNKELYMYFDKTVLVALTAEWCTPCQEYLPELRQFVSGHSDSLAMIEIDIERRSITAFLVGGNYLPSIIVYRKLEPIARLEGTAGIAYFEHWLRPYLN